MNGFPIIKHVNSVSNIFAHDLQELDPKRYGSIPISRLISDVKKQIFLGFSTLHQAYLAEQEELIQTTSGQKSPSLDQGVNELGD